MFKKIISTASAAVMAVSLALTAFAGMPAQETTISASALTSAAQSNLPVARISGSTRYYTAVAVSKSSYPNGTKNVILASGERYVDALCATTLARQLNAPILLTGKTTLNKAAQTEIKRLGAENVYIFGGTSAISTDIDEVLSNTELAGKTVTTAKTDSSSKADESSKTDDSSNPEQQEQKATINVERIMGATRFDTAVQAAKKLQEGTKKQPTTAFFVTSDKFADALSVSSLAGLLGAPVFYVDASGKLDKATKAYLKGLAKPLDTAYIIGGKKAVGEAITTELKGLAKATVRYGGSTRYETNAIINTSLRGKFKSKDLYLASGINFPDALSGGVLAAKNSAPVVLAYNSVSGKQLEFLKKYGITEATGNTLRVIGGTGAVSTKTVKAVLLIDDPTLKITDGSTKATLTWGKNRFITSYQIYRDGKLLKTITDPYKVTYTDSTIYKESTYDYKVVYNYTIKGKKYTEEVTKRLDRKCFDFRWLLDDTNSARLNSEKNNTPKYTFVTENAQPSVSTKTSYDIRYLKTGDWETLKKFANEHFTNSMTKAEKVAYTVNWINKNVLYGTVQDGGWAILISMVNNGTFSYVNCIFNKKIGQCNCYNGALASMMLYLGYDAHLVMGYRGVVNSKGVITSKWQHFWCEVKINGKTYVMEAGNYGEDGDWMHVCEFYKDVEAKDDQGNWRGYIKNGKIVL